MRARSTPRSTTSWRISQPQCARATRRRADAYAALVATLERAGTGEAAPQIGDRLPPFALPDEAGRLVTLADLLVAGPLVVSFNRGNWCPFCWLELASLGDIDASIRAHQAAIVAVTPETAMYNRQLRARLDLPFRILTDLDNGYALELGLAMAHSPEAQAAHRKVGITLDVYQQNDAWFVPLPATLVVSRDGVICERFVSADFRRRIDPQRIVDALAGLM